MNLQLELLLAHYYWFTIVITASKQHSTVASGLAIANDYLDYYYRLN